MVVPYQRGDLVSRVHADGEVLSLDHTEAGTRVRARVRPDLADALSAAAAEPDGASR